MFNLFLQAALVANGTIATEVSAVSTSNIDEPAGAAEPIELNAQAPDMTTPEVRQALMAARGQKNQSVEISMESMGSWV